MLLARTVFLPLLARSGGDRLSLVLAAGRDDATERATDAEVSFFGQPRNEY